MALFRYLTGYLDDFFKVRNSALLLTGARQTGKTFAIRQLGQKFTSFIEINFLESPAAINIFKNVNSAEEILLRISAFTNQPLIKNNTLIFFDEVQECEDIITAIKFLVDDGKYHYALSGSLLGVEIKDVRSIPVGYMSIKEVYPLDFEEFIINLGVSDRILDHLKGCWKEIRPVDYTIHDKLLSLYRLYTVVGGMPAAVAEYINTNDIRLVSEVQQDIVTLYRKDISKYAEKDKLKIKEIFDLIPSELDAKNKRFILKSLNQHAKFERYQNDFLWLKNAGVAIPVYNLEEPKMPLKLAETRNLFKLFSNDVGLLTVQYANGIQLKLLSGEIDINYGAVYENVVAQELLCHGYNPYYYNSKRMGEVDFVISSTKPLPIEVKSGKDYERHNALNNLLECKEFEIEIAYVLSNGNIRKKGKIIYMPIYMTMFIKQSKIENGIYKIDLSNLQ
ncbi:MAG: AAA family ATPase [Muribaculaceae bacterium]|nr:AAA family ATPase [Muribaculaceae bacterium]MDE6753483.1 AAA family ATPase [Muribaculaceae bacterium]